MSLERLGGLKHQRIYQELRKEIAAGLYRESGRLPSENLLAKRYQVSRPTVARALRDLQAQGLIERRAGAGSFLIDGQSAANLLSPLVQLAMLIPRAGLTEIFEVICGELAGLARARGCSLIWAGSRMHMRPEHDIRIEDVDLICEEFIECNVSGVFFAPFELRPHTDSVSERIAQRLRQAGIAVVLLDRDFQDFPLRSDFDLVGIDNHAAGFLLAEHLLRLGRRRIAFVARPFSASTIPARIAGAREALSRHKIPVPEDFVRFGDPEDVAFVRNLVAGKTVDAIICANDTTAIQLLNTLAKIKVRVPKDIRVVGCDDVRYAQLAREPLTTITQPCREIAVTAMSAMLERINDPMLPARALLLNPRLTVRASCGAYLH